MGYPWNAKTVKIRDFSGDNFLSDPWFVKKYLQSRLSFEKITTIERFDCDTLTIAKCP